MNSEVYWIWWQLLKGVDQKTKKMWLETHGHPRYILERAKDLKIDPDLTQALDIVSQNKAHQISTITPEDDLYKPGMPAVVYFQGTPVLGRQSAVVGTRNVSVHGEVYTRRVCEQLVAENVCINSGLALGVDGIAHRVAITNKVPTQAFLAHGLDVCYPAEHRWLKKRIIENGAVYSLYPVGTPPMRHHFLKRNELMVTMSDDVIVTEAPLKSGSLHTAMHALNQKKSVSAIKGTDSSRCAGNNELIKRGAHAIDMPWFYCDGAERKYIDAIREKPMSIRMLRKKFDTGFSGLDMLLFDFETHGWLTHKADGKWHYNGW